MYCINDLRLILSPDTHIRVWGGGGDKALYEGSLEDLQFINQIAKTSITCMKAFGNVLVFFINYNG
jgi:hypothetical protein